eukprot:13874101-Alexandrium_andersonii.AAC.1
MATLGAKLAPEKSHTLASSVALRSALRRTVIPALGVAIEVKTNVRDLGAHMNTSFNFVGPTSTKR